MDSKPMEFHGEQTMQTDTEAMLRWAYHQGRRAAEREQQLHELRAEAQRLQLAHEGLRVRCEELETSYERAHKLEGLGIDLAKAVLKVAPFWPKNESCYVPSTELAKQILFALEGKEGPEL